MVSRMDDKIIPFDELVRGDPRNRTWAWFTTDAFQEELGAIRLSPLAPEVVAHEVMIANASLCPGGSSTSCSRMPFTTALWRAKQLFGRDSWMSCRCQSSLKAAEQLPGAGTAAAWQNARMLPRYFIP